MEIDNIDLKIIGMLKNNGRVSHEAIAKIVKLSRPAVRNRILTLEENGIISGYTANIDYCKLGYHIQVLIYLKLSDTTYNDTMKKLDAICVDDIFKFSHYRVSGEWCILLKILSKSQDGLTQYLDCLQEIDGIIATNTVFLFNS